MFVLIKSRTSSKISHVRLKTRSLGQILEKPCVRSRGHIFSPTFLNFGQNVCLDKISDGFEYRACSAVSIVRRQLLLVYALEATFSV